MKKLSPIFIIGNPRSGTSLLRLMMTNHPEICIAPECGFLQWWYKKYGDWSIVNAKNVGDISEYIEDLSSSKKIETWDLDYVSLKKSISRNLPETYSQLSSLVYEEFARNKSKEMPTYWGDKNNYYIDHLWLLSKLYPNARFVFIIRDGRDVACSYMKMDLLKSDSKYKPNLPQSIENIAKEWLFNNEKMNSFYQKNKGSVKYIRYEDLLKNSKLELKEACDFLNITYSNEMLEYYKVNRAEQTEPTQTMDWKQKTLEKPDATNIGKYKKNLNNHEIETFNSVAEKMLIQFGYQVI